MNQLRDYFNYRAWNIKLNGRKPINYLKYLLSEKETIKLYELEA